MDEETDENEEQGARKITPKTTPKLKKRGWRTVTREQVRMWKRKALKRRASKKSYDSVMGANKSAGLPKNGKKRRGPRPEHKRMVKRLRQIQVLRADVGGIEGKQITLPPKNVLAVAMPKIAPPRLEALLGLGNYRRIARESGFSPMHISNVLRRGRNCSFWAAAQIADAAGVTMDELRIYTEIVRNRVKAEGKGEEV